MKRKLVLFLVLLMVLSVFSGCTTQQAPATTTAATSATQTAATQQEATVAQKTIDFPKKTINVTCPWSAGGGTDTVLRALCAAAEKQLGQSIVVTNTTGGGGATGFGAIMAAEPDGYNFGMITFELSSLPPQGLVDFDYTDFDPLMQVNLDPATITVPIDAPYDTVEEFIAYAKEHPGEMNFSGSGPGSVWQIALGLFCTQVGLDIKWVPSDGAAPAVTDLIGGHLDGVSCSPAEVMAQVKAGNLKILAVMAAERSASFPDVPTLKECGYDVQYGGWRGLALPKGVDPEIRQILFDAFTAAWNDPDFIKICDNLGLNLIYKNSEDFAAFLKQNLEDTTVTLKDIGLT